MGFGDSSSKGSDCPYFVREKRKSSWKSSVRFDVLQDMVDVDFTPSWATETSEEWRAKHTLLVSNSFLLLVVRHLFLVAWPPTRVAEALTDMV